MPGSSAYKNNVLLEEYEDALWSPFERLNATYAALTGDTDLEVYAPLDATWSLNAGLEINTTKYNGETVESHTYLVLFPHILIFHSFLSLILYLEGISPS